MAKELPYYQFEVAEYLAGDIMICSLEAQGLFSVIKCLYWQKECVLRTAQVLRRYDRNTLLTELIEEKCIKVDENGYITISFLDIQYQAFKDRREKLSVAGRKGGQTKKQATLKPALSEAKATLKHLEENRGEEKRVDDTNTSTPPKQENPVSIDWDKLLQFFNTTTGKESRTINNSVKAKFKARLKEGYTKEDLTTTIKNAAKDEYHKENDFKYLTLEYCSRSEIVDRYTSMKPQTNGRMVSKMNIK